MTRARPDASIILPTFNGALYLEELLQAIETQETSAAYEIVAIDSGSSDATLDILRAHGVVAHEIPNSEFNHGATRNLGASMARGDFLVFITQSATPADNRWLHYLLEACASDERVAAAYSRHLPRPGCDPITRRDITEFFKMMGPEDQLTQRYIADGPDGLAEYERNEGIVAFYSDVSACMKASVWKKIPYRPLNYAEDQAMARDLLKAGYWKAYEPRSMVYHSHSYAPVKYFRRQFDEYRGMREATGYKQEGSILRVLAGTMKGGAAESRVILKEPYSLAAKAKWVPYAFSVSFLRRFAGYLAAREERLPNRLVRTISLEAGARKRARRLTSPQG